jgi:hypothetical protein
LDSSAGGNAGREESFTEALPSGKAQGVPGEGRLVYEEGVGEFLSHWLNFSVLRGSTKTIPARGLTRKRLCETLFFCELKG